MKFKKFLNEEEEQSYITDEQIELIAKDCKPFLKEFFQSNSPNFLYSGRNSKELFLKKTIRKDRRPLNTKEPIQEKFDELFYKKFGVKPRSGGMFCTGNDATAMSYGKLYDVFPIGKYKIVWHKDIKDLFGDYVVNDYTNRPSVYFKNNWIMYNWRYLINVVYSYENKKDIWLTHILEEVYDKMTRYEETNEDKETFLKIWIKKVKDGVEDVLNQTVNSYKDNDLKNAIQSLSEIMLVCDEVYLVKHSYEFEPILKERLKNEI